MHCSASVWVQLNGQATCVQLRFCCSFSSYIHVDECDLSLLLSSASTVECARRYLKYGFRKQLNEIGVSLQALPVFFFGGVAEAGRHDFKCSELADSLRIQLRFGCLFSSWVKTGKLEAFSPDPTL